MKETAKKLRTEARVLREDNALLRAKLLRAMLRARRIILQARSRKEVKEMEQGGILRALDAFAENFESRDELGGAGCVQDRGEDDAALRHRKAPTYT
jgi:hypothetical protein